MGYDDTVDNTSHTERDSIGSHVHLQTEKVEPWREG